MTTDFLPRLPDSTTVLDDPVLPTALAGLLARLSAGPAVDPAASALVDQAVAVLRRPGFDTLLSLPQLAFEPFDYQLRDGIRRCCAACAAGRSWPTRSGWARPSRPAWSSPSCGCAGWPTRTLVVTPAGLVEQWREELERKFGLPTSIVTGTKRGSGRPRRPAGAAGLAGRGAPGPAEVARSPAARWDRGGRRRGTPAARPDAARPGSSIRALDRAVPAAADRHPGGEPAAGPLRDDLPGRSRVCSARPRQFRTRHAAAGDDADQRRATWPSCGPGPGR